MVVWFSLSLSEILSIVMRAQHRQVQRNGGQALSFDVGTEKDQRVNCQDAVFRLPVRGG